MAEWFYVSNGQQVGPLDEAHMRAMIAGGRILPDDLVWAPGMPQWLVVRAVPALNAPMAAAPPGDSGAVPLTYASPVENEVIVLDHDEGPFMKIGGQFSVVGSKWSGMTVASPKAIYLMKVSRQSSAGAYHLGGIAGMLIHQAFAKDDDVRTCCVVDLPEPVRQKLDPKGKKGQKDVVVLPRGAIRHVKMGSINNVVTAFVDQDKFTLNRGLFSGGKVRRFFTENGWTLNEEVTPTASSVHGRGLGRTFEELQKKKTSYTKRVILGVCGILLIIAIIVIFVMVDK